MSSRVVVVDAHTLVRQGLARIIADQDDLLLVAEAGTAARGREQALRHRPHVVVVDARLPDEDGFAVVRLLRRDLPESGLVVMAAAETDDPMFEAMEAGASAYVAHSASVPEFLAAVRSAAVAPSSFSAAGMAQALVRRRTGEPLLSPRERQVLALLADGHSIVEISRITHLSHSTVKTYAARLYDKLGAANRAQALMAAVRLGLVRHDGIPRDPGQVDARIA